MDLGIALSICAAAIALFAWWQRPRPPQLAKFKRRVELAFGGQLEWVEHGLPARPRQWRRRVDVRNLRAVISLPQPDPAVLPDSPPDGHAAWLSHIECDPPLPPFAVRDGRLTRVAHGATWRALRAQAVTVGRSLERVREVWPELLRQLPAALTAAAQAGGTLDDLVTVTRTALRSCPDHPVTTSLCESVITDGRHAVPIVLAHAHLGHWDAVLAELAELVPGELPHRAWSDLARLAPDPAVAEAVLWAGIRLGVAAAMRRAAKQGVPHTRLEATLLELWTYDRWRNRDAEDVAARLLRAVGGRDTVAGLHDGDALEQGIIETIRARLLAKGAEAGALEIALDDGTGEGDLALADPGGDLDLA